MSNITTENRATFFPKKKSDSIKADRSTENVGKTKEGSRRRERLIGKGDTDSKVDIPQNVKDFARIKKVVDATPNIDNSEKIGRLKQQIANDEYEINYDDLSEKILEEKF